MTMWCILCQTGICNQHTELFAYVGGGFEKLTSCFSEHLLTGKKGFIFNRQDEMYWKCNTEMD